VRVGAEEAEDLTRLHVQIERVESDDAVVALGELRGFEHGFFVQTNAGTGCQAATCRRMGVPT
jgi:hypothetical protein